MIPTPCDLSVIIPVYGSSAVLERLTDRLVQTLDDRELVYEVIFVDDSSPDGAWEKVAEVCNRFPDRVVGIRLMRNFGQHNALMCGFRHARGGYLVTMDDDLQHPPEEILKLIDAIESSGDDIVYGVPEDRQHRVWRNAGSALVVAFYRLVFKTRITPSAFRIIRRELVETILSYDLNYTYVDGLLGWNTQRIGEVPVRHEARQQGRSGYSVGKLLVLALNLFTNFSLLPLQAVSGMGFVAALFGFVMGGYYLVQSLFGEIAVPGYASTIVAIFVLGGLQLLALGILGEYLGRLHLNVNHKPQYSIREALGLSRDRQSIERTGTLPSDGPTIAGRGDSQAIAGAEESRKLAAAHEEGRCR